VTDGRSDGRTDGQTDGQTESIIAYTALCIASYADALSKFFFVKIGPRASARHIAEI